MLDRLEALPARERLEAERLLASLDGDAVPHESYRFDPIGWAWDKLGIRKETLVWSLNPGYDGHVWDGDRDPIAALFQAAADGQDCAVESATSTGKSFGVAVLVLWFTACWAGARTFTFAPKEDQLRLYIWMEIGKLWPKFKAHFPTATLTDLCLRMRGGIDDSWGARGYAVGIRAGEEVATKAAGMHAPDMLLVYEETPGIPKQVMEAGENTATAQHNFRIAIGNPNSRLDTLHQFATSPGVKHLRISALDHPNVVTGTDCIPGAVSQQSIDRRLAKYGEDSPVYQSRVRGMSPEQSADSMFRLEWLEAAAKRFEAKRAAGTLPTKVTGKGVDVANSEHGDRGAICDFADTTVARLDAFACPDANKLGAQVVREARASALPSFRVGIDSIGVGAGSVNEARRLGFRVQALNFGAAPVKAAERAPDGSKYEWVPDANRFQNARGQTYWQLRDDFQADQIDMAEDQEVWEELLAITFEDEGKVVKIPPKDEIKALIGRSPDKSDALAMANWVRERKVVREPAPVKDAKQPHVANPLVIKNGQVVAPHRKPQTIEELLEQIERKRPSGRVVHTERLPRRTYA